jgi:L-fuconolactonase
MSVRADAHLHFFFPGYINRLPENCRRITPDEVTLYEGLAAQYDVQQVLAVAFEGGEWAAGNNAYVAGLAAERDWIRPVAFVSTPELLTLDWLKQRRRERFVGLSVYLFDAGYEAGLQRVPAEVWEWLTERRWLVSVNSQGAFWRAWQPMLEKHPELRLLVSHLGLPPAMAQPPAPLTARQALDSVLALAAFPGVRVKLSGFYALTTPGYAYPHRAAWPYVEALLESYGSERLLWASDFSPCLEQLSFPQTFGLFAEMPFLTEGDRRRIEGANLLALLADCDSFG